ncbi:MAG: hypothetical protein KTR19_08670 [Hyphomicrobiales bacterium]|nr:hypothetical protein [Hyphomicrobiales bacterium]
MATTYDASLGVAEPKENSGLLMRFFGRVIEARQREAVRRVRQHLRSLDRETLRNIGYTDEEINSVYNNANI